MFLVYQVGCIECGVSSYPVSVHSELEDAKKSASEHPSTWESEGGDGFVTIVGVVNCVEVGI